MDPSAAITPASIAIFSLTLAEKVKLIGVVDADFAAAQAVAREFGTTAFRSVAELIEAGVQAASVAVPTAAHLEVARH